SLLIRGFGVRSPGAPRLTCGNVSKLFGAFISRHSCARDFAPRLAPWSASAELGLLVGAQDTGGRRPRRPARRGPPQWARQALGPAPDDAAARADWEHWVGWAAPTASWSSTPTPPTPSARAGGEAC